MTKRVIALLVATGLLAGVLAGCSSAGNEAEVTADVTPAPLVAGPVSGDTTGAILDFSQALFNEILESGEENAVISPLSAYYALAMAALGAEGETLEEFTQVLGMEPEALAEEIYSLTDRLMDTGGSTALNIADSIWTSDEYTVRESFAQAVVDYFGAQVYSEDFSSADTVDDINKWVSDKTEGLIDKLVDSIGEDTAMLLINTLYLSAKWDEAFNPMTATDGIFYPDEGPAVETEFLGTGLGAFDVVQTDEYEGVMLPYDDGKLGFLLLRPVDGGDLRTFGAGVDLAGIMDELEARPDTEVKMPRFDLEYEVSMNELLENMGLEAVFSDRSDLSGLIEEDTPLYISSVMQKVRIQVDEEGTEAAAATSVGIDAMSLPADPLYLTFDTPYLYAVCELETGIPLFIGVMDNPTG